MDRIFNNFFISGWLLLPNLTEHNSMMYDVLYLIRISLYDLQPLIYILCSWKAPNEWVVMSTCNRIYKLIPEHQYVVAPT